MVTLLKDQYGNFHEVIYLITFYQQHQDLYTRPATALESRYFHCNKDKNGMPLFPEMLLTEEQQTKLRELD